MSKTFKSISVLAAVLLVTACQVQKSANPLSPTVAGPIPGVNITTPRLTEPAAGARIPVEQQPLTLSVDNAATNGVRPLSYRVEVASDAAFATMVFAQAGVAPGATGKTSFKLPQALPTERTYYWHVRAEDGANTGAYSAAVAFSVYTPAVLLPPTAAAPVGGALVASLTPTLTFENAARSGPVGTVSYLVTINSDFTLQGASSGFWWVAEQPGQTTSFVVPDGILSGGKQYFWAVMSTDGKAGGSYSKPESFTTPAIVAPPVGPPGGGGGTDFDGLGSVQIVGGSPDVRNWAVTSRITSLRFSPGNIHLDHTKTGQWPGVDIGGALQEMTLWVFFNIRGQWYATGGERWRPGQTDKALSAPSAIGPGWFYNDNWAPMTGYVPRPGEQVGFMVVAGSTRVDSNAPVKERSGILMIPFPADGVSVGFP